MLQRHSYFQCSLSECDESDMKLWVGCGYSISVYNLFKLFFLLFLSPALLELFDDFAFLATPSPFPFRSAELDCFNTALDDEDEDFTLWFLSPWFSFECLIGDPCGDITSPQDAVLPCTLAIS
mmetsp:Transcript_508/g.602  ORF Transcript_508/g.602 Transcript_508/m.602 type:complete len:123 (-) Transcript_508:314-682(-)